MDPAEDEPCDDSIDDSIDETEEEEYLEYQDSSEGEMTLGPHLSHLFDDAESLELDYYPGSIEEARAFFNLPRGATSADEIPVAGSVEPVAGPSRASNPSPALEAADFAVQDGGLHPLLIPGVVTNLFKFLDVKSLQTCRLVNICWNDEACRALQKIWPATIVGEQGIVKYLRIFGQPNEQRANPHAIFEFYGLQFGTSTFPLDQFFDFYGSCMKSLILQVNTISLTKLTQVLLDDVPNLESLWLRCIPLGPEDMSYDKRMKKRPRDRKRRWEYDRFLDTIDEPGFRAPDLMSSLYFKRRAGRSTSVDLSGFMERNQPSSSDPSSSADSNPSPDSNPGAEKSVEPKKTSNPSVKHLIIGTQNFIPPRDLSVPSAAQAEKGFERTVQKLQTLMTLFPNLERISLSGLDSGIRVKHSRGLVKAITRMPPLSLRLLTQLSVPILVEEAFLRGFLNLNSRFLNDLELIFYQSIPKDLLREFFAMMAPTMSKLSVTFASSYFYQYDRNRFFGEHSTNLKELTLRRFRWNLVFLQNMPILEKLELKDVDVGYNFPLNMRKMENMKILRIENEGVITVSPIDDEILARMARAFPSLTQLHFPGATDDCLRVIYSNLPYLTVLECFGGYFTDSGVTGVTMNVCADLAESLNYDRVDGDRLRMDLFIGNLTKIQTLKLESDFIGEMSVIFGINKCFNLVDLYLKSARITNVAARKITECLAGSVLYLDLLDCPLVTQTGLNSWTTREKARLRNRRLPSAPGPGIDEIARLVRARHANFERVYPERCHNNEEDEATSMHVRPAVERNIVYACHPLPREHAHKELLTLTNYGEDENQHIVMPIPGLGLHLIHAQVHLGVVANAMNALNHAEQEIAELDEDLNPIPINLEDNNDEVINEINDEGGPNPIPVSADPDYYNVSDLDEDEVSVAVVPLQPPRL